MDRSYYKQLHVHVSVNIYKHIHSLLSFLSVPLIARVVIHFNIAMIPPLLVEV